MKITSSFKDFYDGAAGGYDPTCHYIRTEISKEQKNFKTFSLFRRDSHDKIQESVMVFFCGERYIGIKIADRWYYNTKAKEIYEKDRAETKKPTGKWARYSFSYWYGNKTPSFFESFGPDQHKINLEFDAPVVIYHSGPYNQNHLIVNGNLSKVGFGSAVDPFQAYQRIEQFLRNDLAKELDIPIKISDKDRITAHGFDIKTSFRKDTPPTRKQK